MYPFHPQFNIFAKIVQNFIVPPPIFFPKFMKIGPKEFSNIYKIMRDRRSSLSYVDFRMFWFIWILGRYSPLPGRADRVGRAEPARRTGRSKPTTVSHLHSPPPNAFPTTRSASMRMVVIFAFLRPRCFLAAWGASYRISFEAIASRAMRWEPMPSPRTVSIAGQ